MLKESLLYHADVKFEKKIEYIGKPLEWHEMANRLREAYRNPGRIFGEVHQLKNEQRIHKALRQRKGHRSG
jgi:hypothetical protein